MKTFLSVAAAVVLASCASAPAPAPVTVAPVSAAAAAVSAAPVTQVATYEEALPVSIRSFYSNGDPSGAQILQYNPKGLLVRQETLNGNGVLIEVRSGKAKGDLWRITVSSAQTGEVISFEDRTVGPRGELLVQTFLNTKEVIQASNEYSYDKQGRKVLWMAKTGTGGLQGKTVYQFDDKGYNNKTEVFDASGNLTNIFESSFDDLGNITALKGYDASSNLIEQTNFTWKDGRKIKEEMTKPRLRTKEYAYRDSSSVPSGVVTSDRGKVVERQILEYQWFTKTKTAP